MTWFVHLSHADQGLVVVAIVLLLAGIGLGLDLRDGD
jgi:hypothetical protein